MGPQAEIKTNRGVPQRATRPSTRSASPLVASQPIADLQRRLGNRGVLRLLGSGRIQAKRAISDPGDRSEREADRVAEEVMRMPSVQRACAGASPCPESQAEKGRVQRKREESTGREEESAPDSLLRNLGAGRPLDPAARNFFEPRFGADFGPVRIHTGREASDAAGSVSALAFTVGRDIVFDSEAYAPGTAQGRRLLAHELAHCVQQASGTVATGLNRPDDPHERIADEVAARVLAGRDARALLQLTSSTHHATAAVQRQYSRSSATTSNPDALIPIADFITYVEAVERTYSSDTPEQIVTRIRQQYYSGLGFAQLIPDAPSQETVRPSRLITGPGGVPAGPFSYVPAQTRPRMIDPSIGAATYSHLTAHADENAIGDNPSPYLVMSDGSRIDVGHLLLGLDSLLHPRVAEPYAAYGIPGIDPASWAADLALASYWTTYHERNGAPAADAAVKPARADFNAYYNASAPNEDLLGDADSFGAFQQWGARPGQALSQVLRAYYLGGSGGAAGVDRRWRTFCAANGLGYTVAGGTVTWSATIEAAWEPRINRLCDLFESGFFSRVGSMTAGTAPSRGAWPHSLPALRRFLGWLKPRLEAEMSAHP